MLFQLDGYISINTLLLLYVMVLVSFCRVSICTVILFLLSSVDPWKHSEYRVHHDWLLRLDMVHFRNRAFQAGLISIEEKETLNATSRSGPQVHNDMLLSYAQTGGEKSFRNLLATLKLMGARNDEKRLQLSKLLSCSARSMLTLISAEC